MLWKNLNVMERWKLLASCLLRGEPLQQGRALVGFTKQDETMKDLVGLTRRFGQIQQDSVSSCFWFYLVRV